MEIRDYLRMLRQGWITIVVVTVGVILLTLAYIGLAPREYQATASVYVTASAPRSISDLQNGTSFAVNASAGYAQIIQSGAVLGLVSESLSPRVSTDDLSSMVTASVRTDTALIDITVTGGDQNRVATIANVVANSAAQVIPSLEATSGSSPLVRLEPVTNAVRPDQAVSPNVKRSLAIGVLVGLLLGVTGTITRQSLDNRIRRLDDLPEADEIPLLASVPRIRHADRRLVIRDQPASPSAEAFRTLRTNLSLAATGRRVLLVAPAADEHDGAFVAANLAVSIAQSGRKVVLVDLDFRRAPLNQLFAAAQSAGREDIGLGEHLDGRAGLSEVVGRSGIERLEVITAGRSDRGPAEALESTEMSDALATLSAGHEAVVLHAPPVLGFADASIASRLATDTIVTVTEGRTHGRDLTAALIALRNLDVVPAGFVLTQVRADTNNRTVELLERSAERRAELVAPQWD